MTQNTLATPSVVGSPPPLPVSLLRALHESGGEWTLPSKETCQSLLSSARARIVLLRRALTPASAGVMSVCLGRLVRGTRMADEDQQGWTARAAEYQRLLARYPADIWFSSSDEVMLASTWFPSIAELDAVMRPKM